MLQTDIACEKCGKKMVVRMSRRGPFLACPGYPKCKNAKNAPLEWIEKFNALNAEAQADSQETTTSAGAKQDALSPPEGCPTSSRTISEPPAKA